MSSKNITKPEKNQVEITFVIDKAAFDAETDKVYKKNVVKMNVPGFRKGKAPKYIIEKMYGKGVFYEDAINNLLPDAYENAVKDCEYELVSRPDFEVVSIDDAGVSMKAKVFVKPEVELGEYKAIEAERVVKPVSDADVDAEIGRMQERNSRMVDITDRPAENGDEVRIDYLGTVDGVPFEGGKAEGQTLTLGSGQFIPGFEEQVVGHNIGDEFDIQVTFPEQYHSEELSGKDAVFSIKLHAIVKKELPELDDEFAKDVSEFDTFAEYKADVKAKLEERNAKTADSEVDEKLIASVVESMKADIPEVMIENEAENILRDYDNNLRMRGLDLKTYLKYTGMDLDGMRNQFKPQAEKNVKTRLTLEKVATMEKIEASDEEIEDEMKKLSEAYGVELERVRTLVDAKDVAKDVCIRKAIAWIRDNAKITDKPYEEEKTETVATKEPKKETKKTTKKDTSKETTKDATKENDKEPKKETVKKPRAKKTETESEEKSDS